MNNLYVGGQKKLIVIMIREFNKETQKYRVMVAIYYIATSFMPPRQCVSRGLMYITTLQTSKKNTPTKQYDNLYKTANSI
jgi:hypothetical protein